MKLVTKFSPVDAPQLKTIADELQGIISDEDLEFFRNYVKPYEGFGSDQLDNIFLIAELTLSGEGETLALTPDCTVNQENWWMYEDEPDMQIEDVRIPLQMLIPKTNLSVSGTKTFFCVLQAKGNLWDSCKDLPQWIWDGGRFEFMLSFSFTNKGEKIYAAPHATKTIIIK